MDELEKNVGKKPIRVTNVEVEQNLEQGKKPIKVRKKKSNKGVFIVITCVLLALGGIIAVLGNGRAGTDIETVKDSVVMLEVYNEDYELIASGSGFSAYQSNWIVTNFHVIEGARYIKVISNDKKEFEVENIVVYNKKDDLAILEIDGEFNTLVLGDASDVNVKDEITTIGSPMGELNTVSEGIISNTDDKNQIRITAPISHGSSGGVLLDKSNRVIGITSAGYDDAQNLNFAISVSVLDKMYSAYKDRKYGELNARNYKDFAPNIINHNTQNQLEIKAKSSSESLYNYTVDSLETLYRATNSYEIFDTAMYKLGINGFNVNYKSLSEAEKRQAADYYTYLLTYESGNEGNIPANEDISNWTVEEFILELDLMRAYELAIFMVEVDENMIVSDAIIDYMNETSMTYDEKIVINRLFDFSDNDYNEDIIKYFDNNNRVSFEQEIELLRYLGMDVDADNTVRW